MNWPKSILLGIAIVLFLQSSLAGKGVALDTIPFDCEPAFYQTIGNPATLIQYNIASISSGFITLINFPFNANSTAYNPVDNYIYTIARPNSLIRIHADGTWVDLGVLNGLPNNYVGDFTDDGLYYVKGGGATVFIIDVNTLNVTSFTTNPTADVHDWAFRKSDRTFYGARNGNLYALNQVTHTVTVTTIAGLGAGPFGAAFVTEDGEIYISENNTGNIIRIDLNDNIATVVLTGATPFGINDGAACPNAPNPLVTHVFSENDSICIDTSGFVSLNILLNDEGYLNNLDLNSFLIIDPPKSGQAAFNLLDSTINYSSNDEVVFDSLVYSICGDNVDFPACDTATVFFFSSSVGVDSAQICSGEEYSFAGQMLQSEGEYVHTFSNQFGCDSVVTLNLAVNIPVPVTIDTTICSGERYEFLGVDYDQTGSYSQMVSDANGCQSLHTLNLSVIDPIINNIEDIICDGNEVMIGDSIFTKTGLYSVELTAASFCDSIVNLDLTVLEKSDYQIIETICPGDTVFAGNSFYTTTGIFEDIILNSVGCDSTITTDLTVISLPEITISNLEEICSPDKLTFQVRFEINGGDPSSYALTGLAGNLVGNVFESNPLPSGSSYTFTIIDNTGCHELIVNRPPFECLCETDAGTIRDELIEICVGEIASVFHNENEFLDTNDSMIFVLHDGSRINLGNILIQQVDTDFRFDPSILDFNTSYFVAAIAGNINANTGVDFDDICLSISNSAELIFRDLPDGRILGSQTICEGDSALISFEFDGFPPFEITYTDGTQNFVFSTNVNSYEVVVISLLSVSYSLVSVKDAYCESTINNQISIVVNTPPFAEIEPVFQICNNDETGDPTTINFDNLIRNGDRSGRWIDLDNSGATGAFPMLGFMDLNAGTYRFQYQTNSTLPPCENETYEMEVRVIDCLCPSVELSTPPIFCNDNVSVVLDDYKVTNETGTWQIINAPNGSTAMIDNGIFNATNSTAGNYEIEFQLDQIPSATCPSSATIIISISEILSAGVGPLPIELCNNDQPIDLNDLLVGASAGGIWTDVSTIPLVGFFNAPNGILRTADVPSGSYTFRYIVTPQLPCPADTSFVKIEIDNPVHAGDFVRNVEFCQGENTSFSLFDLIENFDTGGEWSQVTGNSIPTNDFDRNSGFVNVRNLLSGSYDFQYKVFPGDICPADSILVNISIDNSVSAGDLIRNPEFCEGTNITLSLFDLLENYDNGGVWSQVSGSAIQINDFDVRNGELVLEDLVPDSYDFLYKVVAAGICPADSVMVSVTIDESVTAGDLIQNEEFCESTDSIISLFDYIENYDLGGKWSLISGIGISSNSFDQTTGLLTINDLLSGNYSFAYDVQSAGICPDDQVIFSIQINPNPIADAGLDQVLDCLIREVNIGSDRVAGFDYIWEGNIGLPNQPMLAVTQSGQYILTVIDQQTGCSSIDSVQVLETADYPQLQSNSIDLTCFGSNDGVIQVSNVIGGTPPFMYSLNGAPFTNEDIFENLTPGEYHLLLEDSKGCTDEFTFQIFEPNELTVTLSTSLVGNSNVIQYGDSLQLLANISGPIDSIDWSPDDAFQPCDPESDPNGCLTQWVYPTSLTTYEVFVINENGCADRSSITVDVEFDPNVYIPSAFTPNDDGINDIFEIYTDENIELIQSFLIFDRWGETVFEAYDFEPGNPIGGWNGQLRNEKMNSAVFAYYAKVLLINGGTMFFEGDVSLLR